MKNFKFLLHWMICILILFASNLWGAGNKPLCEYSYIDLEVLCGGAAGVNIHAKDALRLCPPIITVLRIGKPEQWNENLLRPVHMLMEYFKKHGKLPRTPYDKNLREYVTAMDAPLLAVTAQMAYERTHDKRYKSYVDMLIEYCLLHADRGGFLLPLGDSAVWPLEYSWKSVTEKDAWFVLNGSLYGAVCLKLLECVTQNPKLKELNKKIVEAYEKKVQHFMYKDKQYCWYSLNYRDKRPIINQIIKMIIEIRASKALYRLSGEKVYLQIFEERTNLLKEIFPVYIVHDKGNTAGVLFRAAAPHPYLVDIYPNRLEFLDEKGSIVTSAYTKTRLVDECMIWQPLNKNVVSYRLYGQVSHTPLPPTLLAEAKVKHIDIKDIQLTPAQGKWIFSGDARMQNGALAVNPKFSRYLQANLIFRFDKPVKLDNNSYIVIEVNNPSAHKYLSSIILYTENGHVLQRSGIPVSPGKNLQIYSAIGFKNYPDSLSPVRRINFRLITNKLKSEEYIKLGKIYVFTSPVALAVYLKNKKFRTYWNLVSD